MHANPRKIEQFNRLINVCTISYQNKKGFPQENNTVENFKKKWSQRTLCDQLTQE